MNETAYLAVSERAEHGRRDLRLLVLILILIFLLLLVILLGSWPTVDQLNRSAAVLIRNLLAEGDVRNPEVGSRDEGGSLAGLDLETPAFHRI